MRIFTAIRHSNDPGLFYGGLWTAQFHPALRALGHDVIESQTDLLPTSRFMEVPGDFTPEELEVRAQTTEKILCEVRRAHDAGPVDLFLSYFYNSHFDPAGFEQLRRLGIPSVNFYCNSIPQFPNVAGIAAHADFAWHTERDARPRYLQVGARPVWVQLGANAAPLRTCMTRHACSCFVGQRYADRDRWVAALSKANVPVDVYGSGWGNDSTCSERISNGGTTTYLGRTHPVAGSFQSYWRVIAREVRTHGPFGGVNRLRHQWNYLWETRSLAAHLRPHAKGSARSITDTFSEYAVILNFSNIWADGRPGSELIPHVRLRDFEAPISRCCYLTGYTDEIAEFYAIGREIDTYRTPEELVDKTRFYLAHPEAAERLRAAGYERACRDHTWQRRFEELFLKLGLKTP